jgi:CheY-like chemotaxis protein
MDGFQFLAAAKSDPALCDIPVILISARDPAGHAIVSNALAITRKGGFSVPQLLSCVEAVIGSFGMQAEPHGPGSPEGPGAG